MGARLVTTLENLTGQGQLTSAHLMSNTRYDDHHVFVFGTFVADAQVEISSDGTNFFDYSAALSAPGFVAIPHAASAVRVRCSGYTSGTIESQVSERDLNILNQ